MFGKLLSVSALAGVALAQILNITEPLSGSNIPANTQFEVQVQKLAPADNVQEVALIIGATWCPYHSCSDTDLGHVILYNGTFNSTLTNGNEIQSFNVTSPGYFQGPMRINAVDVYLEGPQNTLKTEYAGTDVNLVGGSG